MTADLEVWMCVDGNGDYAVGTDADAAREQYEQDVGELNAADGFRLVKLTVTVTLLKVLELAGTAPEEEAGTLAVATS